MKKEKTRARVMEKIVIRIYLRRAKTMKVCARTMKIKKKAIINNLFLTFVVFCSKFHFSKQLAHIMHLDVAETLIS